MRYYFSKLDKEGREIYKKLYFGMQNFEKKISLKGTENIVREIYYMIIKDNEIKELLKKLFGIKRPSKVMIIGDIYGEKSNDDKK